jgi:aminoglycoside 3-N-acetyltransferase
MNLNTMSYDNRLREREAAPLFEGIEANPRLDVSPSDVTDALRLVGVTPGSVVLLHPDAIVAAQFPATTSASSPNTLNEQRLDLLLAAVQDALNPNGTLVIPTFTYSFTKGETFDVRNTPSAVGMVSERFRKKANAERTLDPIFSFACSGPQASKLCALPVNECFGGESVFAALHRWNAHIIDLGCSMNRGGTFVHYVETAYGVAYRYRKVFHGTIVSLDGRSNECSVVYNVRDLTRRSGADLCRLEKRLADDGKSRTVVVGRSRITGVRANDLFETVWKMLDEDPAALIEEGVGGRN